MTIITTPQEAPERIPPLQQVDPGAVLGSQTPLSRLEQRPRPPRAMTREAHRGPAPRAAHVKGHVDAAAHLVHLAPDPGDPAPEVDVVAEHGARAVVGPQGVQRRRDHGRRRLLVVEDGGGAGRYQGQEDGEAAGPAEPDLADFCGRQGERNETTCF